MILFIIPRAGVIVAPINVKVLGIEPLEKEDKTIFSQTRVPQF
jgi:hypothetical protein